MPTLAEKLNLKLRLWQPNTVEQVLLLVSEIIELADQRSLDILRFRTIEQEVLALLDD